MDLALELATAHGVDVVMANDPDADRLAVAIPDGHGGWQQLSGNEVGILLADDLSEMPKTLAAFNCQLHPPRRLSIHYRPSETGIEEILAAVRQANLTIADLTTEEGDLEDIFLALTRRIPSGD